MKQSNNDYIFIIIVNLSKIWQYQTSYVNFQMTLIPKYIMMLTLIQINYYTLQGKRSVSWDFGNPV